MNAYQLESAVATCMQTVDAMTPRELASCFSFLFTSYLLSFIKFILVILAIHFIKDYKKQKPLILIIATLFLMFNFIASIVFLVIDWLLRKKGIFMGIKILEAWNGRHK